MQTRLTDPKAATTAAPSNRALARIAFLLPQIGNGADGISDIEGKATRVGASEWTRRVARDKDGKTERSNGAFGKAT